MIYWRKIDEKRITHTQIEEREPLPIVSTCEVDFFFFSKILFHFKRASSLGSTQKLVCSFFFRDSLTHKRRRKKKKKGKEKETNVTWTRKDLHTDEHGGRFYIFPFSSFQPKKLLMWCATWWVGVPLCVLSPPPHTHTHIKTTIFFVVVGEGDPGSHNGSQPPNKRARYIPPQ